MHHQGTLRHPRQQRLHDHLLEGGLEVSGGSGDDSLRADSHRDVVEERLCELLLYVCHVRLHLRIMQRGMRGVMGLFVRCDGRGLLPKGDVGRVDEGE